MNSIHTRIRSQKSRVNGLFWIPGKTLARDRLPQHKIGVVAMLLIRRGGPFFLISKEVNW
jgi:hypothetical protein